MTKVLRTINGEKYNVEIRERGVDFYDIRYVSAKTGWSALARTRGYADYSTHSLPSATAKARKLSAELNR